MKYQKTIEGILENIGGKENIKTITHCATRLRMSLYDSKKVKQALLEDVDLVKGVFTASGQLQIIFGTGLVNKVYDEMQQYIGGVSTPVHDDGGQQGEKGKGGFLRAIKVLGDIFVPIIPAIVASGLLMGLLEGLTKVWPELSSSGTYTIIHLFSNAAFVFLPILIAMSAAKTFGGNIFLGAVIGMIMIHTDLVNAWAVAGMDAAQIPKASVWFGLYDVSLTGYQGHVIPVVIAVFVMSKIERKLHKIVPEIIDLFVTPLVTVLVTGYLTLTIIGPVFAVLENWVLDIITWLLTIPFGIGAFLAGAVYAPTVVSGVHHMYNALEASMLSATNVNTWMPIATAANVAQGAAALAVALKTKKKKVKSMALPASLSAFLGITEPAIFGVNIRFMTPFVAGMIGGAFGALVGAIGNVGASAYGVTGVFGFLITTNHTLMYLLLMVVASVVAFVLSWILFKEKPDPKESNFVMEKVAVEKRKAPGKRTADFSIKSPMRGKLKKLEETKDTMFSQKILGDGVMIVPTEGKVFSPFDGEVISLFETCHAIGLRNAAGVEILIHVGINTVELRGEHYKAYVKQGDKIKEGQILLEFDKEKIEKSGYPMDSPVVITNSDEFKEIRPAKCGKIEILEDIIYYG